MRLLPVISRLPEGEAAPFPGLYVMARLGPLCDHAEGASDNRVNAGPVRFTLRFLCGSLSLSLACKHEERQLQVAGFVLALSPPLSLSAISLCRPGVLR